MSSLLSSLESAPTRTFRRRSEWARRPQKDAKVLCRRSTAVLIDFGEGREAIANDPNLATFPRAFRTIDAWANPLIIKCRWRPMSCSLPCRLFAKLGAPNLPLSSKPLSYKLAPKNYTRVYITTTAALTTRLSYSAAPHLVLCEIYRLLHHLQIVHTDACIRLAFLHLGRISIFHAVLLCKDNNFINKTTNKPKIKCFHSLRLSLYPQKFIFTQSPVFCTGLFVYSDPTCA
jgi:hypothetical protein